MPTHHNGHGFVADNARGIDILRFTGEPGSVEVQAPPGEDAALPQMAAAFGYMCPTTIPGLSVA